METGRNPFLSPLLRCKSNSLFPDWEIMPRKSVTQSEFEKEFEPFALSVVDAVEQGWDMLSDFCRNYPVSSRKRNVKPTNLNAFIVERLASIEGLQCGELIGRERRSYVRVGDNKLFVKKIGEHLRPSYISTKTVQMYHNQETLDFDDDLPITYLGYQTDKGWTHITGVYAVHMIGDRIEWFSDIADLAYKGQILHSINQNEQISKDVEVTLKVSVQKKLIE